MASSASKEATEKLNKLDATLKPGAGHLGVDLFLRGDAAGGLTGGTVGYTHRVTSRTSLFTDAWAGYGWGDQAGFQYGALAGLRWTF